MKLKTTDKNNNLAKLFYSVLINLAVMTAFLLLFERKYDIADDTYYIDFIANGCYNYSFMNNITCFLLVELQKIIYPLSSYVVSFLALSFVSFTTITLVFTDRFNFLIGTLVTLFLNGFFAVNHYDVISFTRMPAILTVAGFLAIIHYSKRNGYFGIVFGIILAVIGSMIRFEIFEVSLAMICIFVFSKSISEYYANEKSDRKLADFFNILFEKKRLISAITVVAICFGMNFAHKLIVNSDKGVSDYWSYTCARSAVLDYPIPDYAEAKQDYDSIDVSENDIAMIRSGYFDAESSGGMSAVKLKGIKEIKEKYDNIQTDYVQIFINMIKDELAGVRAFSDKGVVVFCFGLVFILFLLIMKKRNYFIPVFMSVLIFACYYYLWIKARAPFRAVYVLWLASTVYMLYSVSVDEMKDFFGNLVISRKKLVSVIITIIGIFSSVFGLYYSESSNWYLDNLYFVTSDTATEDHTKLYDYINENSDLKFEFSRQTKYIKKNLNGYCVITDDGLPNTITFSCPYGQLPYTLNKNREFGSENLFSYLLEDGVYFVDNNEASEVDMFAQYLSEHYSDTRVVAEKIKDMGTYTVYNFK